jgi:hypothetical protein
MSERPLSWSFWLFYSFKAEISICASGAIIVTIKHQPVEWLLPATHQGIVPLLSALKAGWHDF